MLFTRHQGYTFIEVLITLSLIGLLMSWVCLNYHSFWVRHQINHYVRQVYELMQLARNLAISKQSEMIMRIQITNIDSELAPGLWLMNSQRQVIQYIPLLASPYLIRWQGEQPYMKWSPDGQARGSNGTFYISYIDSSVNYKKSLIISNTGKVRLSSY